MSKLRFPVRTEVGRAFAVYPGLGVVPAPAARQPPSLFDRVHFQWLTRAREYQKRRDGARPSRAQGRRDRRAAFGSGAKPPQTLGACRRWNLGRKAPDSNRNRWSSGHFPLLAGLPSVHDSSRGFATNDPGSALARALLISQATPERGFVSQKSRTATRTPAASPLLANAKLPGCAGRGVSQ